MIRGIIKKLIDDPTVTALVDADSIYPVVAKQNAPRPYVTVRRAGEIAQQMKGQTSNTDRTVFNVIAYSDDYQEAVEILYAVRAVIDGIPKVGKNETIQGVTFHSVWYENTVDSYDKDDLSMVIIDTYVARWSRL